MNENWLQQDWKDKPGYLRKQNVNTSIMPNLAKGVILTIVVGFGIFVLMVYGTFIHSL